MSREDIEEQERARAEADRLTAAAARRKHGEWVRLDSVSTILPDMTGSRYAWATFRHEPTAMATPARQQYLTALYEARRRFQSFLLLLEKGKDIWVEIKSAPYEISGMTELEAELLAGGLRRRDFEVQIRSSTTKSSGEDETFDVLITDPVLTLKL